MSAAQPNKPGLKLSILITNKHVVQEKQNGQWKFLDSITLRVNNIQNDSFVCLPYRLIADGADINIVGHPEPNVDLAAILIPPIEGANPVHFDIMSMVPKVTDYPRINLTAGTHVFSVGYLLGYAGLMRNHPVVTFGRINLVSEENWFKSDRNPYNEEQAYLAQLNVTGGASGSPIFLDSHVPRMTNDSVLLNWTGGPVILGVIKAGLSDLKQGGSLGIAACEPVTRLRELLNEVLHLFGGSF